MPNYRRGFTPTPICPVWAVKEPFDTANPGAISLQYHCTNRCGGFTLIEVTASLLILSMIIATVLVVANRAMDTVLLWQTKMEAFEITRENMEKILAGPSVTDRVESGISEKNPDISWQTTIESFYEPITEHMWMRAICSAEFTDAAGQEQKIEFTHWLAAINKTQFLEILGQKEREEAYYKAMAADGSADELPQDAQQDSDAAAWKQVENQLGPPPEGYAHWGQVPQEEFWKAVTENIFKK